MLRLKGLYQALRFLNDYGYNNVLVDNMPLGYGVAYIVCKEYKKDFHHFPFLEDSSINFIVFFVGFKVAFFCKPTAATIVVKFFKFTDNCLRSCFQFYIKL